MRTDDEDQADTINDNRWSYPAIVNGLITLFTHTHMHNHIKHVNTHGILKEDGKGGQKKRMVTYIGQRVSDAK